MINSGTRLDKYKVPYNIFQDYVHNEEVMGQLENVVKAPGVLRVALMPDCHVGYTSPVGCIVETADVVYPAVVGYDIGCGVISVPVQIPYELVWDNAVILRDQILNAIHVGVGRNYLNKGVRDDVDLSKFGEFARDIGTLGGGNHFLEVGVDDSTKQVWVSVHSGSRGFGHAIGTKYMRLAAEFANSTNMEGLNGLEMSSSACKGYIREHDLACEFAMLNRKALVSNVVAVLANAYGPLPVNQENIVSCIHNFMEVTPDGNILHRKGATKANKDALVAIPGSMRDGIIIAKGLGCEESLNSCSHGAGRVLSRAEAKKQVSMEEFEASMVNVPGAMVSRAHLDECPAAYKNIDEVMSLQSAAVESVMSIRPIINIKG